MFSSASGRSHASVQAVLPLERVDGDAIVLRDGGLRAVLETGSVNFALRSEAEQEAILAGYRRFLNALTYPLQVLVRVVPAEVDAYLAGLRAGGAAPGEGLARLRADHEAFVRRIARERVPLARRFYVVVPAETGAGPGWPGPSRPWTRGGGARRESGAFAAAARLLAARVEEVVQGLAGFGVPARQLASNELLALWRATIAGDGDAHALDRTGATPVLTQVTADRGARRA